jgi:4-amino-4-deoxy-L-arabinose transferase-like glycosyltransferase
MMKAFKKMIVSNTRRNGIVMGLVFLFVSRFLAMCLVPINDTTEARYAEIARKMLETGNWITPWHDYGTPFWAKPPLSIWLSAVSMKLFGVSEWAVRLPSMILSMGVVGLVWCLAKKQSGSQVAINTVMILCSSVFFMLNAGAVMTDASLLFCLTLCMVSFWLVIANNDLFWRYPFFIGLGLGLLAKGPIVLVLAGFPLFVWVFLKQHWSLVWQKLPWIKGLLVTLLIALPWYWLAETQTPGFLNYFILGEHVHRFLDPSWLGDKYGYAHQTAKGMIWIYALVGLLPWTITGGIWLLYYWRSLSLKQDKDGWISYLLLFMLTPLVFFTFAQNIIYPYVFPCIPAFALLFAELSNRMSLSGYVKMLFLFYSGLIGIVFLIGTALFHFDPQLVSRSQKPVIALWQEQHPLPGSRLIYWTYKPGFSAQFYSQGLIYATTDLTYFCELMSNHMDNFVVTDTAVSVPFPESLRPQLTKIASIKVLKDTLVLYRTDSSGCH